MNLNGESREWPFDETFRSYWQTQNVYYSLQNPKIVHILKRLSDTYLTGGSEEISVETPLTIEHLIPSRWIEHWPLPDGSKGLTESELWNAEEENSVAQATRQRKTLIQTLGNLTILTQPLNSSVQNREWDVKKPALLSVSLLPINQQLHAFNSWDEKSIEKRSKELFERAVRIWPRSVAK